MSFGNQPAKVADDLVELIRAREFSGRVNGTQRVMILIELMSKPVQMALTPASIRRAGWYQVQHYKQFSALRGSAA